MAFGLAVASAGCQDGYPIAATRCDRWCDATQATECGRYNPAGCVVSCEATLGASKCVAQLELLTTCAEAKRDLFECREFYSGIDQPCTAEQTAAYACALPYPSQGAPPPTQ
jgi:hypothetical protein